MAKAQLGSNATFTSTGTLTTIGDHCYFYSGNKTLGASYITMAQFVTGAYYLKGHIYVTGDQSVLGNNTMTIIIRFNGIDIIQIVHNSTFDNNIFDAPDPLIIPPNTEVLVRAAASGVTPVFQVNFIGNIYEA